MGKMLTGTSHLPYAVIRFLPDGGQVLKRPTLHIPRGVRGRQSPGARQMQGVHHLAPHIQLQLSGGGIADAHGAAPQ